MSKPRMCEDCRWCTERDKENGVGKCAPSMPWWLYGRNGIVKLKSVAAIGCPRFERKRGKSK